MVRIAEIPGIRTGQWYRTSDGSEIRILHIDTDEEAVEIENSDGDIEELDLDSLVESGLRPIASPSFDAYDYTMDFDSVEHEQDRHTLDDVLDTFNY